MSARCPLRGPAAPPPRPAKGTLNLRASRGWRSASGQSREALAAAGRRGWRGGLGGRRGAWLCGETQTARGCCPPHRAWPGPGSQSCAPWRSAPGFALPRRGRHPSWRGAAGGLEPGQWLEGKVGVRGVVKRSFSSFFLNAPLVARVFSFNAFGRARGTCPASKAGTPVTGRGQVAPARRWGLRG